MPKKILVVDDQTINRRLLGKMLSRDYFVIEARGGQEALDVLRTESDICAVMLDIYMPGMDGYEVLRRIRANPDTVRLPVIMITGSDSEKAMIKSLELGANDFVIKPYNYEIILHCLRCNITLYESAAAINAMRRDSLTGLYSREAFFDAVRDMVAQEEPGYYVMLCCDINKFKIVNDQYGTYKGDEVLKHTADVLREGFEPLGGLCCRISVDNYAVLYPASYMHTVHVSDIMDKASVVEGIISPLQFSVGMYVVTDLTLTPAAMYDRAMLAASSIKGRADSRTAFYNEAMRERLIREQSIVSDMEAALENRQFEIWYQPQYNHSTKAMIGAEALVRWRHPEKGIIPPGDFIPIFERNGFIYNLDKYVWEEACRFLKMSRDSNHNPLPISVNVSRYDVLRPDFIKVITGLVEKYSIDISSLRLEITESAFAESSSGIVRVVKDLIEAGFTVEIDDFGSGYSSLNTLKDVPAQIIKLDMKFLEMGNENERGGNIVESIVRMTKWLGVSVIAEGVETARQADYLRSVGCSYIQGYFYSKPIPESEYIRHCSSGTKEEHLLTLETVENLNNNSFWNPESMDTLIFNSYVGGACIFEYHNGRTELLRANEKYAQVLGNSAMTIEEALKLDWREYLDEESDRRIIRDIEQSVATRKETTGVYSFLDLPGCPHQTYLRFAMRVIACTGERYLIYCTSENITSERLAQRERDAALVQLQSMMDDMPGGYARIKIFADGSSKAVYVNEGFVKLVGMTHEEVVSINYIDAMTRVHPDDVDMVKGIAREMLNDDELRFARYRLRRSSGEYIWLSVVGRSSKDLEGDTYLNLYYSDATEQVKQEEVRKSLLDNLPCGAGVYELKGGQMSLVYQNNSYWDMVGLKKADLLEAGPMSAIYPDDVPAVMKELQDAIMQKRDVSCDVGLRHLTRGYIPVHLAGRIVHKQNGEFSIYATFTPIAGKDRPLKTDGV